MRDVRRGDLAQAEELIAKSVDLDTPDPYGSNRSCWLPPADNSKWCTSCLRLEFVQIRRIATVRPHSWLQHFLGTSGQLRSSSGTVPTSTRRQSMVLRR